MSNILLYPLELGPISGEMYLNDTRYDAGKVYQNVIVSNPVTVKFINTSDVPDDEVLVTFQCGVNYQLDYLDLTAPHVFEKAFNIPTGNYASAYFIARQVLDLNPVTHSGHYTTNDIVATFYHFTVGAPTSCSTSADCLPGYECVNGKCQPITGTVILTILQSDGNGSTSPPPDSYTVGRGSIATVNALPDKGYRLHYWVVDGSEDGTDVVLQLTMDTGHVVKPFFEVGEGPTPPQPSVVEKIIGPVGVAVATGVGVAISKLPD